MEMDKHTLFKIYNKARKAAREGKLDIKRLNRALGILQSKNYTKSYVTTIRACSCPDWCNHPGQPCKHMIAEMIKYRASHPKTEGRR